MPAPSSFMATGVCKATSRVFMTCRIADRIPPPACAGTVWVRFVTVHREDQDLLRDEARRMGHYQPITTNYTGDPAAPIQHFAGTATMHGRRARRSAALS